MRFIEHLIEPDRLLLSWQAQDSKDRSRFVVGELVQQDGKIVLIYHVESSDFKKARELGFSGYPAFQIRSDDEVLFEDQVLEAFTRRLPPRRRSDFYRYLELRGLAPDKDVSDFALLGYTGARLPDDGFELVHPFDNASGPFEFIAEVAGFRHEHEIPAESIELNAVVDFVPEPDNHKDANAIRIEMNGYKLGYVDRGRTQLFHRHLEQGHAIHGHVVRKNGTPERPLIYIYVSIEPTVH